MLRCLLQLATPPCELVQRQPSSVMICRLPQPRHKTAFCWRPDRFGPAESMHRDLVDEGHEIGRHRTARLMRQNQLIARQKRRFKRMTDSEYAWPVAPNLVAQDFTADGPDRKWGADISYIWTAEGWLYFAVVLDLFSRPSPWSLGPVAFPWLDPPFRSRIAILLSRLSGAAPQTWHLDLDEWARELLRQLDG